MKVKSSLCFIMLLSAASCNYKEDTNCTILRFANLNLHPVNAILKIPSYKITDTAIWGDGNTILHYDLESLDTYIRVIVSIKDFAIGNVKASSLEHIADVQKAEIRFGKDSIIPVIETYKNIDSVKIGYLKYLVHQNGKNIMRQVYFFTKERN